MTREDNIRAILESCFAGYKDEIINVAAENINMLSERPRIEGFKGQKCDVVVIHGGATNGLVFMTLFPDMDPKNAIWFFGTDWWERKYEGWYEEVPNRKEN